MPITPSLQNLLTAITDVTGRDAITKALNDSTVSIARQALAKYLDFHNRRRPHSLERRETSKEG